MYCGAVEQNNLPAVLPLVWNDLSRGRVHLHRAPSLAVGRTVLGALGVRPPLVPENQIT